MRIALFVILSLALSGATNGQPGDDSEQVVELIVSRGIIEGRDRAVLLHLGDSGAVLVTKILADSNLTSKTIGGALIVVENSFAEPKLVDAAADRQPRTSLLLLRYLELSTNDAESRKNIADTRKYIQDRYASFLKAAER